MPLDLLKFVRTWNASLLTERSAAQQHFRDLCEVLEVPHPTETDEIGAAYTFEKRVRKTGSADFGYADVWKRGWFAWEYKSKGGDLKAAYKQLNEYHEALDNPPLLVVCDFTRFEVHTKFENSPSRTYAFTLDDLLRDTDTAFCAIPPLEVLRHVFGDYNQLRPGAAAIRVTRAAAGDFLRLAQQLELEKVAAPIPHTKQQIAHFLMRLVFCLFADSVELLPNRAFRALVTNNRFSPIYFNRMLPDFFAAMSAEDSFFGPDQIPYFNGGLFSDNATILLNQADLGILYAAAQHDWSHIEPVIFGTLFERSLDAAKRSMIGAHYTSAEDILLLIEPVVMAPLQRRWQIVRQSVLDALAAESPAQDLGAPSMTASSSWVGSSATNPGAPSMTASSSWVGSSATNPGAPFMRSHRMSGSSATNPGAPHLDSEMWADSTPSKPKSKNPKKSATKLTPQPALKLHRPARDLLQSWAAELTQVTILDPACGSGNFLYIALKRLLDLWHEARVFGIEHGLALSLDPIPHPGQLFGIEIDFYAHEIASIVVWIGFLQWKRDHGIKERNSPVLQKLSNIEHADAIMRYDAEGKPCEPEWHATDFIVGNPPFLGGKFLRRELGDPYIDDLFRLYEGRVRAESDLVVYWFEKARAQLEADLTTRVGLLATQGIRGGANRNVLERILRSCNIFWAISDRAWLLNGANVRISMVAFEKGSIPGFEHPFLISSGVESPQVPEPTHLEKTAREQFNRVLDDIDKARLHSRAFDDAISNDPLLSKSLNGKPVEIINSDLTSGLDLTSSVRLLENRSICFMGTTKVGAFDIDTSTARKMLSAPVNPNGRPNSDVVRPWINSLDVTRRNRGMYIIDFGVNLSEREAALYELPFEYVRHHVHPARSGNSRSSYSEKWWLHGEPRAELRLSLSRLRRFIITPTLSKHRLFVWLSTDVVPDHQVFSFAREDDYFFGVLHCQVHKAWSLAMGTQLEDRPRYTPKSTFDTFPFPHPPNNEPRHIPAEFAKMEAIAAAARRLVELRDAWLNPPDTPEADLKKRTLTNLYNQRPTWLADAHRALDEAVFAAYGWPSTPTNEEILARLLALNHERAATQ